MIGHFQSHENLPLEFSVILHRYRHARTITNSFSLSTPLFALFPLPTPLVDSCRSRKWCELYRCAILLESVEEEWISLFLQQPHERSVASSILIASFCTPAAPSPSLPLKKTNHTKMLLFLLFYSVGHLLRPPFLS